MREDDPGDIEDDEVSKGGNKPGENRSRDPGEIGTKRVIEREQPEKTREDKREE